MSFPVKIISTIKDSSISNNSSNSNNNISNHKNHINLNKISSKEHTDSSNRIISKNTIIMVTITITTIRGLTSRVMMVLLIININKILLYQETQVQNNLITKFLLN